MSGNENSAISKNIDSLKPCSNTAAAHSSLRLVVSAATRITAVQAPKITRCVCSRDPHFPVAIAPDIFQAVRSSQRMLWVDILEGL
jgi:hypothetical protein